MVSSTKSNVLASPTSKRIMKRIMKRMSKMIGIGVGMTKRNRKTMQRPAMMMALHRHAQAALNCAEVCLAYHNFANGECTGAEI